MRPIWKGSINFGLVNISVKMLSATRENELKFILLHNKDHSRIRYAHICRSEEKEVPWDEIVRGYEHTPGEFVVLDKNDFAKAHLERTKSIEILNFIPLEEIDSTYFVKPYFLVPEKNAERAYFLLCEALKKTKKAGLARYVYHNREYLAVIREYENSILLNQLRYEEEILQLPKDEIAKVEKPSKDELTMAIQLVDQLTSSFQPSKYKSTYTQEIQEIIDKKVKGKKIHPKGEEAKPTKVHDIMSLLKASLQKEDKKPRRAAAKKRA